MPPISAMFFTCVPPQGCKSIPGILSSRTRPVPRGGCTLMVLTSSGRESSSSSVIHTRLRLHAPGEQRIRLLFDPFCVEKTHVDVEIEPRLVGRDIAAGNRSQDHARHH